MLILHLKSKPKFCASWTVFIGFIFFSEEDRNEEIITEFKTTLGKVENAVKILFAASLEQDNR